MKELRTPLTLALLLSLIGGFGPGCGRIADKDQIVIAKVDDTTISRGDLYRLIYEMDDTDRPKIRNKNDMLRILDTHIDTLIKIPLGKQLAEEGKITVEREVARNQFFVESGDEEEYYRSAWEMEIPKDGQVTPLMKLYNLTPSSMQSMKDFIEEKTDDILEQLLGERAIAFLAAQDLKAGKIPIPEEDIEREYRIRKDSLIKQEWLKLQGIYFPVKLEDAITKAAAIRKRIDAGESFDEVLKEAYEKEPNSILQSEIERNPQANSFQGFWREASGAGIGDVIGPVFMPAFNQIAQTKAGKEIPVRIPECFLVFKVLDHRPERNYTMEEARVVLITPLLMSAKMNALREEHGVEVYRDKLPDPAQFAEEYNKIAL